MIRPLFALEDVVLYIFVAVRSFFFWIFLSVYSRAMDVPGLSNLPRPPSSSPHIAAGSSSAPSAPAGLARAPPRPSGSRSAWSTRGRIVEGILSIFVCVYLWRASGVSPLPSLAAILLTGALGFSVFIAVLEALSELSELHAPSSIVFDVLHKVCRLWSLRSPMSHEERTDLGGVDLFEYDYFQTLSNFRAFTLGAMGLPAILAYFSFASFDFFASLASQVALIYFVALVYLYACCGGVFLCYHPFIRKATFGKISKWQHHCINQPRCRHVRVFLLATGTIYMVLLYVSDVPSGWTSSLIMTHSTRLLSLLVALRGDNETVADAAEEVVEHVQEVG
ncbi:unnamed protein product [Ectocarpus fasciculatus]